MKPYSITCTTCKSRLKVRSKSAIGKIVACPKCQSMVLIEPPGQAQLHATAVAEVPSAAISDTAPGESPAKVAASETPRVDPPIAPPPVDDRLAGDDADGREEEFRAAPPSDATPVEPEEAIAPPRQPQPPPAEDEDRGPLLPNDDWTSQASRQVRQYLMLGGAALLGVVLAIVLFVVLILHFSDSPRQQASVDGRPAPPSADDVESAPPKSDADGENDSGAPAADADDDSADAAATDGAAIPPTIPEPTDDAVDDAPDPFPPADGVAPLPMPPEPADDGAASPPPVGPPGLTPRDDDGAPDVPRGGGLPDELKPFAPFLDDEPLDLGGPIGPRDGGAAPPVVIDEPDLPRPPERKVDVAARLADPIGGMEFASVPLYAFVRYISRMSTIPITIDPEALAQAGITANAPLAVAVKDATLGDALTAALAPRGLAFETVGEQLILVKSPPEEGKPRAAAYDIGDLAADEVVRKELLRAVGKLVAPDTWKAAGGAGEIALAGAELRVRATESVHYRTQELLGKLRLARKLPLPPGTDEAAISLTLRGDRAAEMLSHEVSLTYVQPTRFTEILQRIEEESGLRILIDWRVAAEAGWNPLGEARLFAHEETVATALTALLRPMDLTYRIFDGHTLVVTTPARVAIEQELELHPLGDLLSAELPVERLLKEIQAELGAGAFREAGGRGDLYYDESSKHLAALLTQPRQDLLAKVLDERRSALEAKKP